MTQPNTTVVQSGLGLPMVLFLIFLVLRLTDQIDWPWYAVAAPLLIGWGLVIGIVLLILLFALLAAAFRGVTGLFSRN